MAHHSLMPLAFALLLLSGAAPAPSQPATGLFLSPMGEPYRSAGDNVAAWFGATDRDADGSLTPAELRQDAARFFASLDLDRNGELGPAEIARYESEVAPEVQVGLQMRSTGVGDWRGERSQRRRIPVYGEGIEGAARYAFLKIPQPVIAADSDMNRGVSSAEFGRAADERFARLDTDRDGRLLRAELPPLPQPRLRRKRNDEEAPMWRRRSGY